MEIPESNGSNSPHGQSRKKIVMVRGETGGIHDIFSCILAFFGSIAICDPGNLQPSYIRQTFTCVSNRE
jgi:hypothetical protein